TQDERATLSPVKASELVLRQVRTTLQQVYSSDELRDVVLTVPASFDQVARKLTVQAAEQAGFAVTLLEEPQAAFYDWLHRAPLEELEALAQASRPQVVLVVDVGGGTTDLTLLRVSAAPPESRGAKLEDTSLAEQLAIERVAVGRHLLLGGDNIDLALAHLV